MNDSEVTATGTTGLEDLLDLSSLKLYPNPATDQLNLQMGLVNSGEVAFSLQSMVGQTVLQQTNRMLAGPQEAQLNVASLTNGIYLLRISIEGEEVSPMKVVIHR